MWIFEGFSALASHGDLESSQASTRILTPPPKNILHFTKGYFKKTLCMYLQFFLFYSRFFKENKTMLEKS